jgi:hypothetical protein
MSDWLITCNKKNHRVPMGETYAYRDVEHGIPDTITICHECLFEHVTKYYPGGTLESVLIDQHPDWAKRIKDTPNQLLLM